MALRAESENGRYRRYRRYKRYRLYREEFEDREDVGGVARRIGERQRQHGVDGFTHALLFARCVGHREVEDVGEGVRLHAEHREGHRRQHNALWGRRYGRYGRYGRHRRYKYYRRYSEERSDLWDGR